MLTMSVVSRRDPFRQSFKNEDYVDEFGINHGKGVKIGETIWAPVNCGYHQIDFKYGKSMIAQQSIRLGKSS